MQKIGIGLGRGSIRDRIEYAKLAEKAGYDSLWISERPFGRDVFSPLVPLAMETVKIRLCTSTVPAYLMTPVKMAMCAATIDELSNGRMILGIGTGNTTTLERIGVQVKDHISAMREYVLIVKDLLLGKVVTSEGKTFSVKNAKLDFTASSGGVPVFLAAVRPKMLRLAGEICDGVILTAHCSPKYVADALKNVRLGMEAAGRKGSDFEVACLIATYVSDDSQSAELKTKETLLRALSNPGIFSDIHTWEMMFGPERREQIRLIRESLIHGDLETASKHMTGDMVNMISISGKPDECRRRLNEFLSAGVTIPIISPIMGSDFETTLETFKQK